jgi:hypothetical protein
LRLDTQGLGRSNVVALERGEPAGVGTGDVRVAQERGVGEIGEHLFEDRKLSRRPLRIMVGGARNVSAGTGQRCGGADPDRISDQLRDDRNRRGGLARGSSWRATVGCDNVDIQRYEFSGKSRQAIQLSLGISGFEDDVCALDIAQAPEFFLEQFELRAGQPVLQHAYTKDFRGLLRLRDTSRKGSNGGYDRY